MNRESNRPECGSWLTSVLFAAALLVAAASYPSSAAAQQVVITTPLQNIRDSYYERIGIGWNYSWQGRRGNMFFSWPGLNAAPPPFGGWGGNDATFGFGWRKGNSRFNFNMALAQGNTRSMTMVAPSVTVPNGYGGSIFSGSLRPFVTGWVPVVGQGWSVEPVIPMRADFRQPQQVQPNTNYLNRSERLQQLTGDDLEETDPQPAAAAPSQEPDLVLGPSSTPKPAAGSASSTEKGGDSLTAIRQQLKLEGQQTLAKAYELIIEGQQAELAGQKTVAAIYYRQAANRCEGELRLQLLKRAAELRAGGK